MFYHIPVLLEECIKGLNIKKGGTYVDVTFGGGGHTRAILKKLKEGRVVGIDQDEEAEEEAKKIKDRIFSFTGGNFRFLKQYLKTMGIERVEGIIADLGVSSHQFDIRERGFSTRAEGLLDMRMDRNSDQTAFKVVNTYNEKELTRIFKEYGEIRNARSLALAVISSRINKTIGTTADLQEIARNYAPLKGENKYFARVFQAIRIEVNDEMGALKEFLLQTPDLLNKYGRLVIISYHSLEDRMVKNLMVRGKISGEIEKDFFGNQFKPFKPINKKPVVPSADEISSNNRARSAKLRIAEKT